MEKTIISLRTPEHNSSRVIINVEATMLKSSENKETREELHNMGFHIKEIDADSIKAEIKKDYFGKVLIENLETKGWAF